MKSLPCIVVLLLFTGLISYSQPVLTRSGSYTYYAPSNQSLEQAKKIALERAKQQIIENEYGTVVGVSNISRNTNQNGVSSSSFHSYGETEVMGEWIGTVGEPVYEMFFQGEMLVIKVSVTGKIREIISSSVELEVRMLRNGIEKSDESEFFTDDDRFFISFKSPIKGYVAVYQYDSDGLFRLLPYKEADLACVAVNAGKEYVFFCQNSAQGVTLLSEIHRKARLESKYRITCGREEDLCKYYIVFSPNPFVIANDDTSLGENVPAQINMDSFQKWMSRAKRQDRDMIVLEKDLILRKK